MWTNSPRSIDGASRCSHRIAGELFKIQQQKEEVFKIQQEREKEVFKNQQEREVTYSKTSSICSALMMMMSVGVYVYSVGAYILYT